MSKTEIDKKVLDSYIKQVSAGDREEFRKLYDYVKTPVFLFALSIVKNRQTAEDILQETMMKVAYNCEKYSHGTNSKAWLLSITRNICNDILRSFTATYPLDNIETTLMSETDLVKNIEETDAVLSALQILSQQEREIVSLYVYAGFSQVEIAKTLGIPYVKVRSQYGYALKKLRIYFEKKEKEYVKEYKPKITGIAPNTDP